MLNRISGTEQITVGCDWIIRGGSWDRHALCEAATQYLLTVNSTDPYSAQRIRNEISMREDEAVS